MAEQERKRCGAKRPNGKICNNVAGQGTDHHGWGRCKFHTGSTKAGNKAAAREYVEAQLMPFRAFGDPIQIDPAQALLEEVHRAAGHVAWVRDQMDILAEGASVQMHASIVAAWHEIYMAERQQLARVAKMALDAGIAERQVQLAEQQGALLAGAIRAILADLALSPEQRQLAPAVVRRHLQAIPVEAGHGTG